MKIQRIVPFLVDRCLLVRVYTDSGIVGTGEAGLWAHHRMVYEAINDLAEYYVGKDASLIEHHFQVVSRNTHFMGSVLNAALSAIDIALWDIMGKSTGKPVHELLGGKCRNLVKAFANVSGNTLDERARSAQDQVAQGYKSLRTIPFFQGWEKEVPSKFIGDAVDIVKAIREAVGYGIDLGLEIHRDLRPEEAIALANELMPYRLLYYEDPVAPESLEAVQYVAKHINIPIATGERLYSLYQFKHLLDMDCCSLIRFDLSLAGGFTQCKKIAAMLEASFVGAFPHLMGSPVNIAAYVQLDAAIPNYMLMENYVVADVLNEIVDEPLKRENGYFVVPNKPGIGLDLREDKLAKFPYKPMPIRGWFREDGSVIH